MKSITERGKAVGKDRKDEKLRIGDAVRIMAWGYSVPCYRVGEIVTILAAGPTRLKCKNRDGEIIYPRPSQVRFIQRIVPADPRES